MDVLVTKAIEFTVFGFPSPKGSMRAAGNRVIPSGSPQNRASQADWGSAVRAAAVDALSRLGYSGSIMFVGVPLRMQAVWRMQRPMGHFHKKGPNAGKLRANVPKYPISAPDSSKMLRSTEDWLNKLVFDDDAKIAEHLMRKVYALPGREGAWIRIEQIKDVNDE